MVDLGNEKYMILAHTLCETLQSIGRLEEWKILPGTGFCSPAKDWLTQNTVCSTNDLIFPRGQQLPELVCDLEAALQSWVRQRFCILRL